MDITSLLSTLLSDDSVKGMSKSASVSGEQTRDVLGSALPLLLGGVFSQSNNSATADGFAGALQQHSASDTSDLGSFFGNVDTDDGAKIVQHLLGSNSAAVTKQISEDSGVAAKDVSKVLASAAPLLMSLLGKETKQQQAADSGLNVSDIIGSLLGGSGAGSLLTSMLGGGTSKKTQKSQDSGNPLMSILGSLLK